MAVLISDNKTNTLRGVVLLIISSCLNGTVIVCIQWYSEKIQCNMPSTLMYIFFFQLMFTLLSSIVKIDIHSYPSCFIDVSIELKNMLHSVQSIHDVHHKPSKRVSTPCASDNSSLLLFHTTHSNSISSYGSMTTLLSTQQFHRGLPFHHNLTHKNQCSQSPDKKTPKKPLPISLFFIERLTPNKIWLLILLCGLFQMLSLLTLFQSLRVIPVLDALCIKSSCNLLVSALIGCIVLSDPLSRFHALAMLLAITGCVLMMQPVFLMQHQSVAELQYASIGYVYAFASAVCTALRFLCIRIARKAPSFLIILSETMWNFIACVLFIAYWEKHAFVIMSDWRNVLWSVLFGVMLYAASFTLTKGAQRLIIGVSSVIKVSVQMMVALSVQLLMLSAYHTNWMTMCGSALSLMAVIIVSMEKIKKAHNKTLFEILDINGNGSGYNKYYGHCYYDRDSTYTQYAYDDDEQGGVTTFIM